MADAAPAEKGGSGSRALLWLLILLLLGAVWWLASERNARKYTLASRDGVLLVSRGRYFPTGTGLITPEDPEGKLYAGIALPPGSKNIPETEYDDEGALDRGLYDLLSSTAHALAKKGDAASFAAADELARRLSALRGLSAEELADLNGLRAELAYWSAGGDVRAAAAALVSARRKLEEVRANGGEHAPLAGPIEDQLEPIAAQLAAAAARFSAPGTIAMPNIGTQTNLAGQPAEPLAAPAASLDGGEMASDAGSPSAPRADPLALPAGTNAAPSGANTLPGGANAPAVPPVPAAPANPAPESELPRHGASAPGSVSSGASRGN